MTSIDLTPVSDVDQSQPDWVPASRTRRGCAWLISSAANTTLGLGAVVGTTSATEPATSTFAMIGDIALTATAAAGLVHVNVIAVSRHGGKPGHRTCRLKLKDERHQSLSKQRAAVRFVLEMATALLAIGGLIMAAVDISLVLFTPGRRRIVDRLVGTVVLQARSNDRSSRER